MNTSSSPTYHSGSTNNSEKKGRVLLDLLRTRDKLIGGGRQSSEGDIDLDGDDNNSEISQLECEISSRLISLGTSIRRRGLFVNAEKAQAFYSHASDRSSSSTAAAASANRDDATEDNGHQPGGGSSKKRKRKKGGGSGGSSGSGGAGGMGLSAPSYGIYLESNYSNTSTFSQHTSSGGGGEKQDLDEGLILTAICRILGVTVGRKKKDEKDGSSLANSRRGSHELILASLHVLSSLCDHAKDGMIPSLPGDSTCASIEGDMVGSIGLHLLDALHDNILYFYHNNNIHVGHGSSTAMKGLIGCFKACASVVSLLETRLSRANEAVNSLRGTTWLVLNTLNGLSSTHGEAVNVQKGATALVATLALAGDSDGTPPSKIWSRSVSDGITLLQWAIQEFFPMPSADGKNNKRSSADAKEWKEHEVWLSIAKEVSDDNDGNELDLGNDLTDIHRSQSLQSRIQCLTSYIRSLLTMEGYPLHRTNSLSSTLLLPLDALIDTAEILLSFPLAAEAKHRSTKSRLRSTPVKDGLISPNAALDIAANVRLCGHDMLDVAMESCRGGSSALGRARRLVAMAMANLQSSCSEALLSVVDGRRSGGGVGMDKVSRLGSWLRGSMPLRIKSIQTFYAVAMALGSGAMSSTGTSKSVCRALVLVAGSLLEQVTAGDDIGLCDEWGTLGERAKLVEISANALASCVAAFGGLIPNNIRSTIDSMTQTCLSKVYSFGGSSIFAYSHVKISILQLGMNCICVPWGDGGRSSIDESVRAVSSMLKNDPDLSVGSAALSTLCTLDAFTTPRAPPILTPAREAMDGISNMGALTASSLLQGMTDTKIEMMAINNAKVERRAAKSDKKSNKKAKKEKTTIEINGENGPVDRTSESPVNATTSTVEFSTKEKVQSHSDVDSKVNKSDAIAKGQCKSTINEAGANNDPQTQEMDEYIPCDEPNASVSIGNGNVTKTEEESNDDTKSNSGDNNEEDDDSSLDDFPDIIDEGPDEDDC